MTLRVKRGQNRRQSSGAQSGRKQDRHTVRSSRNGAWKILCGVITGAVVLLVLICIFSQDSSRSRPQGRRIVRRSASRVGKGDKAMRDWMIKHNYQNNKELAARKARIRVHNGRRASR